MPDIEVSEKAVASVEGQAKNGIWVVLTDAVFIGDKEEVKLQAEEFMNSCIKRGWPRDEIRVTYSRFTKKRNIHSFESAKEDAENEK